MVTGSSTGIGKAIALELDARGFQVFAGVRKHDDGVALSREASAVLKPIPIDVTDESLIVAAVEAVAAATGGVLVMHETLDWFEAERHRLPESGFVLLDRHLLPKHFWWTEYGEPLERRVREFRKSHSDIAGLPELTRFANESAMIEADPDRFDCGFFIFQKQR